LGSSSDGPNTAAVTIAIASAASSSSRQLAPPAGSWLAGRRGATGSGSLAASVALRLHGAHINAISKRAASFGASGEARCS